MDVLVCFKIVADIEKLSEEDWIVNESLAVDVSFVKNILNCFDESALEMALKLSDYSEDFDACTNLTALTIGDKKADSFLKTLYALRFNKAVRIENDKDIRFNPEVVATVIKQYVEKINKQDVIILGRQSGEGDNAKTPLLVAEMLEWPCISQVTEVEWKNKDLLKVTSIVDGGTLIQTVKPPCVLAIGNVPNSYLRVPTLKDKMKYGKTPIDVIDINKFDIQSYFGDMFSGNELIGLKKINTKREGIIVEGQSPEEKAKILYKNYLKERLGKL